MRQNRLNSRRILGSAARQWRANLHLFNALLDQLDQVADQLAHGWTLLSEHSAGDDHRSATPSSARPILRGDRSWLPRADGDPDPTDVTDHSLRSHAQQAGVLHAPSDFAARVRMCLPADPPPFDLAILNPYAYLRQHSRLVAGALGVSALLTFGASWLIAVVEPSLAFAILAALVSLVILLAEGGRLAWETASGAASNPLLMLVAMSAPVIGFLVLAPQLSRLSAHLSGMREA
jgi:hypothetical protein